VKLRTREVYGAVIVDIEGHLVGGPNSETFRLFISDLLKQGKTRIIVNLRRCPWANSQGIGMLIGAYRSARNAGGDLVLSNVTDKIHSVLTVARLLVIFNTFETVEKAIDHLGDINRTPDPMIALPYQPR
jgi:anti-anti-sigma factor